MFLLRAALPARAGRFFSTAAAASPLVTTELLASRRVCVVTLNDPARLNALTEPMGDAFARALAGLDLASVGAVVLRGAGDKAFSAGGDLEFLRARGAAPRAENVRTMLAFYARFLGPLRGCRVPVVAAVAGAAVGAGACLATAADCRVVASSARIGFTFPALGIHAGMGGTHFLPRVVGPGHAAHLLLSGEIVSGAAAARMGWAQGGEALGGDASAVVAAAVELAAKMAAGAPAAVRAMTRTLRAEGNHGLEEALEREAHAQARNYEGEDFRRGLEAVASKAMAPTQWTQWAAADVP